MGRLRKFCSIVWDDCGAAITLVFWTIVFSGFFALYLAFPEAVTIVSLVAVWLACVVGLVVLGVFGIRYLRDAWRKAGGVGAEPSREEGSP